MAVLSISGIIIDPELQQRAAMDETYIDELIEAQERGEKLPPVRVAWDGAAGAFTLVVGFHRIAAAEKRGKPNIDAEVIQCDRLAALRLSLQANAAHGLKRTNEDKARAVRTALVDAEWFNLSNRAIAEMCSVSPALVDRLRKEDASERQSTAGLRIGRDGTARPPEGPHYGRRGHAVHRGFGGSFRRHGGGFRRDLGGFRRPLRAHPGRTCRRHLAGFLKVAPASARRLIVAQVIAAALTELKAAPQEVKK